MASRKQEHIEQITERCLIAQKSFSFKERAREIEIIGARDVDVVIANFLVQVREFWFLIFVKKTISIKILILRVINSSRRRNCFVGGLIYSLVVCVKSPHSLVPPRTSSFGFSHKQFVNTTP